MLNTLYYTACRGQSVLKLLQRMQFYASFTVRDVLRETSDETGTLLTSFAKHIALERYRDAIKPLNSTKIRYADFFPITDEYFFENELQKIQADQIPALIIYASSYRSNAQPPKYAFLLNQLDKFSTKQIQNMDMYTVLETLYAFMFLVPNWITRLDFYHAAIERLVTQDFKSSTVTKEAFVQLCFYMGLHKKHAPHMEMFLHEYLPKYVSQLTNMDLAIVCNAAFKTATIIKNNTDYEERLMDAVLDYSNECSNDALFVTYIKAMRLQRVHSERVCLKLAELCQQPKQLQKFQIRGLAHLFSFFAEQFWDHADCLAALKSQTFSSFKQFQTQETMRPKDLATLLWCFSQLNCELNAKELEQLERMVITKLNNSEYDFYADNLVDTCLSLWMLGRPSHTLFIAAFELKAMQQKKRRNARPQPKVDSRLTVLHAAASIEQKSWLSDLRDAPNHNKEAFNINQTAPEHLLKERKYLKDFAERLKSEAGIDEARLVCPIDGINIPSVLVKRDGTFTFVDVLMPDQLLKFSKTPIALLRFKQRLLEHLGHKNLQLPISDVQENYENIKLQLIGDDVPIAGSISNQ